LQNDTLCSGEQTKAVDFTGEADFYEWTATATVSGLPTGIQTGNFGNYTVTNTTSNTTKSIITVTPKFLESRKECETSQLFEIVVYPETIIRSLLPAANTLSICGKEEVRMEVSASGKDIVYQWYFNGEPILGEQNTYFLIPSASELNMGEYYVEVSGVCGKVKSRTIRLDAGNVKILVDYWNKDEILVNNSSRQYIAFQWYKNEVAVPGATKGSYREKGGLHGCYSVEVMLSDGKTKIFSCERCFDKTKNSISLYPNPVKAGEMIKVRFGLPPNGYVNFVSVEMYNAVGQEIIKKNIVKTQSEIDRIKERIENCQSIDNLILLKSFHKTDLSKKQGSEKKLFRIIPISNEWEILIGRSSKENDILTCKTAKPDDYWFHSRVFKGTHVVLRNFMKKKPSEEMIKLCCGLAAFYSKAKNSTNVPVDYTQIRYVRKPRGAAAGFVVYTNQKTYYADPIDIRDVKFS